MKKNVKLLSVLFLLFSIFSSSTPSISLANTDFENNRDYYYSLCTGVNLSIADKNTCRDFQVWLFNLKNQLDKDGQDLKAQLANAKREVERVRAYIAVLSQQITQMEAEIKLLEGQIVSLEQRIFETNERIKLQMYTVQTSINTNSYLEFVMAAESFSDMFRRVAGIEEITSYMVGLVEQMEADKKQVEENKLAVEAQKVALNEQREEMREQEVVYLQEAVELEAAIMEKQQQSAASASMLNDIQAAQSVITSNGWRKPTNSGVISAGTWNYPASFGGGLHLGLDIALPIGSNLYAPANGIVLDAFDGCADVGYLGNSCGGTMGNNLTVAVSVNNKSYVLIFMHLQNGFSSTIGWPSNKLITFVQSDLIGKTASSGSSTGAHVHIEVIDMGTKSLVEVGSMYKGDKSMGVGFGSRGYNNRCEVKGSTPCRQRPESVFGGFY